MRTWLARARVRASLAIAGAAALALLAAGGATAPAHGPQAPGVASPQVALDWNATAMATLVAAGKSQPEGYLYVGLTQAAVYDAVIAVEGGFEPYLIVPGVPPGSSSEAAAAAAAYGVLSSYFPAQQALLDTAYTASLAAIPDGPAQDRGVLVGQQVATGLVAARIDDGRGAPFPFAPALAPGVWRPTPPALLPALHPWFGAVKPLLIDSPSQFRPGPPPPLGSRRYARNFEETRLYGALNGSLRTPAQTETARFYSENVPVQFNRALRGLISTHSMTLREAARALAMADMSAADAIIACWDAKNTYAHWRPVTAIPAGDTDDNPRTAAYPDWQPLLTTPNHPEYPSGHACVSAAGAEAIAAILGTNRIELDISSTVTNTSKHFKFTRDYKRDVSDARVWGGIHWRVSDEAGLRLGENVAHAALYGNFEED